MKTKSLSASRTRGLRVEALELRELLSVSSPIVQPLLPQAAQFNESFFVYANRDAGGNHFTPSWYTNGDATLQARSDALRGPGDTAMRMVWSGGPGNDGTRWNGLGFEEPQGHFGGGVAGNPYALFGGVAPAGARLLFDARIDPKDLGDSIQAGFGEAGDTCGQVRQWTALTTQWRTYSIDVAGRNFSSVHLGFLATVNDLHDVAGNGVTWYLDNVRYTWPRPDDARLVQSYVVQPETGTDFDTTHANTAYIYDQAIVGIVTALDGTTAADRVSRTVLDGMHQVLQHDWTANPGAASPPDGALPPGTGRLYDAYMSGDPLDNQYHHSRPTGWWDESRGWLVHNYGLDAGVNCWAILAALDAYGRIPDDAAPDRLALKTQYLADATAIAGWITAKLKATDGGYYIGWKPDGSGGWTWAGGKSVEHNTDAYAAFTRLSRIHASRGDLTAAAVWRQEALHAGDFVMSMYDHAQGRFYAGVDALGAVNQRLYVLDAQTWTYLALGLGPDYADAIDWTRQIRWAEANLRFVGADGSVGFDFGYDVEDPLDHQPDGIWWEGTAQMALVYRVLGETANCQELLDSIQQYYGKQGGGLLHATDQADGLSTGIVLSDGSVWRIHQRGHVSAQGWWALAVESYNPYWSQIELGAVAQTVRTGENPSGTDRLYRLEPIRDGFLTAEALTPGAQLQLLDSQGAVLTTAAATAGGCRLDWQAAAGEAYYLRLSGAAEVTLRLTNLVQTSGSSVTVYGTERADSFTFVPGLLGRVTINEVTYDFTPAAISSLAFHGGSGADRAELTASASMETGRMDPGSASLSGGAAFTVDETETIHFYSGGGGDVIDLYGGAGSDTFTGRSDYGAIGGMWNSLPYANYAWGFGAVRAHGSTAQGDIARLYGSAGPDTLIGSPVLSTFAGEGFSNSAESFTEVHVFSSGQGGDQATLTDTSEADLYTGRPDVATLASDVGNPLTYLLRAVGFAGIAVNSSTGNDTAILHGSDGNDSFTNEGPVGRFTGPSAAGTPYAHRVENFPIAYMVARAGADDVVQYDDTALVESFLGDFVFSRWAVALPDRLVRFRSVRFDRVTATCDGPENTDGSQDKATFEDSAFGDMFTFAAEPVPAARMFNGKHDNRAVGFRQVIAMAIGPGRGIDWAELTDSSGADVFETLRDAAGEPTIATLHRDDAQAYGVRVSGFEKVHAKAIAGGDDWAWLRDSGGADELVVQLAVAQLSAQSGNRWKNLAEGFAHVRAVSDFSDDGDQVRLVDPITILDFQTIGPW